MANGAPNGSKTPSAGNRPPPKVIFRPESGAPKADPGTNGAPKMGPKIEKMQWKKTSENRCRKSVENHGKMARELWPNAW